MPRVALPTLLSLTFCIASSARAVDGVIEFNQASAEAGGINGSLTSDPAGFPITITKTGSYRLTGNLTVPANTTAIRIEAENVKIDLGGFEVKGPNTCTGYPVSGCTFQSGAPGIHAPTLNQFLISVHNGTVIGMAGPCIDLQGNSSSVDGIVSYYCGTDGSGSSFVGGIRVGAYGRVSRSHSSNCFGSGISLGDGGSAQENESRGNKSIGIIMPTAPHGGSMTSNRVFDNGSAGLFAFSGTPGPVAVLVSGNVATGNVEPQIGGSIRAPVANNLCNGIAC